MSNPVKDLENFGQSPWVDMISRGMLASGELKRLIDEDGAKGVTSNPTIFDKAISGSSDYDAQISECLASGIVDPKPLFEELAIRDIRGAADALLPVYEASGGADGFVSLEVSPDLAYDAESTAAEAKRLFETVSRKNLMIKIPATKAGLPAIEAALAAGINVNVTLIFSLERYMAVMNAYLAGIEKLIAAGGEAGSASSVASFFVSRIDSAVDGLLPEGSSLRGRIAVANAKTAYHLFEQVFASPRFAALKAKGARVQRPLWASTGTKNPEYSDVLYVAELIGPDTVNTMPPATWEAFRGHGVAAARVGEGVAEAKAALEALKDSGVDLGKVAEDLEAAGVKSFAESFESLLAHLRAKTEALRAAPEPAPGLSPADPDEIVRRLWQKDASLWKGDAAHREIIENSLGWLRLPIAMIEKIGELESFAAGIKEEGFEHAVVLGMGGSSLAPEVFRRSFPARPDRVRLHVLDSTEPDAVAAVEAAAPPGKTLYIVASKSGTTAEPLSFFRYFYGKVRALKGEDAGRHFAAITDPATALEDLARERGFRKVFLNFPDIGGRYSALSLFGLVPAALMGVDIRRLLESAGRMSAACQPLSDDNPGALLGNALADHALAGRDKVVLAVSPEIESLGLWLEQLIAESVGKEGKGVVPVAGEPLRAPEVYAEDKVFVHIALRNSSDRTVRDAAAALAGSGRPVIRLELAERIELGAEFFRWEIATAVLGARLGIDPFDQPDVQAAKDKTKALLREIEEKGSLAEPPVHIAAEGAALTFSAASLADLGGNPAELSLDDALTRFLAEARPGDYAALLAYLCPDGRHEAALGRLRAALLKDTNASSQFGYGPRYLHSTGQLHKGGPDNGIFIVLCRRGGPELSIPETPYGFGELVSAQARGDFSALDEIGRRAVLIRLGGGVDDGLDRLTRAVEGAAHAAMKV